MKTFDYKITDPQGIHARPAGILVKEASKFAGKVMIEKGGKEVDAKRIMAVMSLGAKTGETVTVKVEGEGEEQAAQDLEAFFKENL